VSIVFAKYSDEVVCDVVSMHASYLLLGASMAVRLEGDL
jgi:hypothetical protein